jgi:hypothetical protein
LFCVLCRCACGGLVHRLKDMRRRVVKVAVPVIWVGKRAL